MTIRETPSERPLHRSAGRVSTGVAGLDTVLAGGLPRHRLYLVEGEPGTGKTTLGLQFLLDGQRRGEVGMYVTLSESTEELQEVAASHGWALDGIILHELRSPDESLKPEAQYTVFHPSEVELEETTHRVLEMVERRQPSRVVLDSLSEMKLLARDPLRYRRQILALKQFFIGRRCTVLLLDDRTAGTADSHLQSLVHGVVSLEQLALEYGAERRRLRITKLRGVRYRGGFHDFIVRTGGLVVFPRLVAGEHRAPYQTGTLASGVAQLDSLLGGGLHRGSATLLIGPAGVGKSVVAAQYAVACAERDERVATYLFDEKLQTYLQRADGLRMPLRALAESGRVEIQRIDPAELSPGEFNHQVRQAVVERGVRLVVIDSLNGYLTAMPDDRLLTLHLHELVTYIGQHGVTTVLTVAQHGVLGGSMAAPIDVSYLADTVILLRYFEAAGEVRQAISVVKHRSGNHERTIREFRLGPDSLRVGAPLNEFHGVLTGVPTYTGERSPLLGRVGDAGA